MEFSPFKPIADAGRAALQILGAGAMTLIEFLDRPIAIHDLRRDPEAEKPKPPPLSRIPERLVRKGPKVKVFHFKGSVWGTERSFRLSIDLERRRIDTRTPARPASWAAASSSSSGPSRSRPSP